MYRAVSAPLAVTASRIACLILATSVTIASGWAASSAVITVAVTSGGTATTMRGGRSVPTALRPAPRSTASARWVGEASARTTSTPRSRRPRAMLVPSRPVPTIRTGPVVRASTTSVLPVYGAARGLTGSTRDLTGTVRDLTGTVRSLAGTPRSLADAYGRRFPVRRKPHLCRPDTREQFSEFCPRHRAHPPRPKSSQIERAEAAPHKINDRMPHLAEHSSNDAIPAGVQGEFEE